jgi:hypothetical protein
MLPTYKATLRGDRLEWEEDVPDQVRRLEEVTVYVTILDQAGENDEIRGQRMAEALARLAEHGGVASIDDPVQWQREQREDREIPGQP